MTTMMIVMVGEGATSEEKKEEALDVEEGME